MPTTVIVIPKFSGAFMIPADFPAGGTLQVECVGAGGAGGNNSWGGGAYSKTNAITGITAGQTVYIQTGAPGSSVASYSPKDTWFNKAANSAPSSTTNGCLAKSGSNGTGPAPGGQASAGVGDVKYSGGTGGDTYYDNESSSYATGGGGGAAGPNGAGGSVYTATYNTGGGGANGGSSSVVGGAGGNGRDGSGGGAYSASGTAGNGTNGGGGGATNTGTPGSGGIDLIWTDFAGVQWGPCGGGGGNLNSFFTGYGGGACRLSDVGTINSILGIVVLTYTTGTATSNFVDAVPGVTPWFGDTRFINSFGFNKNPYAALGYYYVPYGVTSIKVEAIGSAISSANFTYANTSYNMARPPGGAAFASRTITVTPGGPLYLSVNGTYTNTAGVPDTWVSTTNSKPTVDSSSVVLAKGNTATAYTGAQASASFGDVKYSGGNSTTYAAGGAAGPNGAGGNGGDGTNGPGGGGGANGGSSGAAGTTVGANVNGGNGGNNRLGAGGGTGAIGSSPSSGTNGTNGGGGGGGGSYFDGVDTIDLNPGNGSLDNIWTTTNGTVYGVASGAGSIGVQWAGGSVLGYGAFNGIMSPAGGSGGIPTYGQYTGVGLIVFSYTYVPTAGGNFLQFF
jgi:hypothetical protein